MVNSFNYYTSYKTGAIVRYTNNKVYRALADVTRIYPTNTTYWEEIPSIGKIFFCNRGTYNAGYTYNKLDIVTLNGRRYIALLDGIVNLSPANDNNNTYWLLMATSGNYIPTVDSNGILWKL